jgi:hypothetical protein
MPQKADMPKCRYAKKPICQKADIQKADLVNLSRKGYVGALIYGQGLQCVHIVLKAASTECSAGSNDHFVVVGGANFHYCLVSLMWKSAVMILLRRCLECLKNYFYLSGLQKFCCPTREKKN